VSPLPLPLPSPLPSPSLWALLNLYGWWRLAPLLFCSPNHPPTHPHLHTPNSWCLGQPNANIHNATWVSQSPGGDTIVIPSSIVSSYYIFVYGFLNCSFSIVAHVASDNSTTRLVPGQPQRGFVPASSYDFYSFGVDVAQNFTFTVTPLSGTVVMFINPCVAELQCSTQRPSVARHTWTSTSSLSAQVVSISTKDPHACSSCTYVISVYASTDANYTIVAASSSTNSSVIVLQVGG
jgi:hypothetical protein